VQRKEQEAVNNQDQSDCDSSDDEAFAADGIMMTSYCVARVSTWWIDAFRARLEALDIPLHYTLVDFIQSEVERCGWAIAYRGLPLAFVCGLLNNLFSQELSYKRLIGHLILSLDLSKKYRRLLLHSEPWLSKMYSFHNTDGHG
jgi:hypothetical protein